MSFHFILSFPELAFGRPKRDSRPALQIQVAINCCDSKATRGRVANPKRRETRRNPKYSKAARRRAALRNISKRRGGAPH